MCLPWLAEFCSKGVFVLCCSAIGLGMESLAAFLLAAGDAVDLHGGSTWSVEEYRRRASEYEAQPFILKVSRTGNYLISFYLYLSVVKLSGGDCQWMRRLAWATIQ